MIDERVAVPQAAGSGTVGTLSPRRRLSLALYAVSALLLIDAVIAFLWHRPAVALSASPEVAEYVYPFAVSEAMWSGGGNLVAAVAAAIAARLWDIDNQWGRTVTLILVTGFGFHRFLVLFDMLGDVVAGTSVTAPSAAIRLLLGLVILPVLVVTMFLAMNRTLTRTERHRALTGADAHVQPPQVRELALLCLWYGIAWVVTLVLGFISILMWSEYGGNGVAMPYPSTLLAAGFGCIGGLALGGCGLTMWLGQVPRGLWYVAGAVAGMQLSVSIGVFLWESVPRFSTVPSGDNTWWIHQLTDVITVMHVVFVVLICLVLWSPQVRRYFRSQR